MTRRPTLAWAVDQMGLWHRLARPDTTACGLPATCLPITHDATRHGPPCHDCEDDTDRRRRERLVPA